MEQRRLRLGDILDDYCPRERRVTNHAVVAMIEEDVKQTRCTTCDAEHAYKGARVPRRRSKDSPAGLYQEVLAGLPEVDGAVTVLPPRAAPAEPASYPVAVEVAGAFQPIALHRSADVDLPAAPLADRDPRARSEADYHTNRVPVNGGHPEPDAERFADGAPGQDDEGPAEREDEEPAIEGPVHRRLIRATLPRPEGLKDARPLPEFTVRQTPSRPGGHGAGGQGGPRGERMRMRGGAPGEVNGNRAYGNSGGRFQGNRPGGGGRQPMGRAGGPQPFRGSGGGPKGKRGRGSRG